MKTDTNVNDRNSEQATKEAVTKPLNQKPTQSESESESEPEVPLFLRYTSEGKKGDAQDEKDKSAE